MTHYARLTCVLALGACALTAQVVPVPSSVGTTGMVGLAETQTAQLNLLNPGVLPPALGVICAAGVSFVDAAGTVLKSTTLAVLPGKSLSFSLHDTDLALAAGERREIRALIAVPAAPPPNAGGTSPVATPACRLIPTLEIYDTGSGRTLVTLGRVEPVQ